MLCGRGSRMRSESASRFRMWRQRLKAREGTSTQRPQSAVLGLSLIERVAFCSRPQVPSTCSTCSTALRKTGVTSSPSAETCRAWCAGSVQVLVETAHGESPRPPRAIARTPWGLVVVEASWLVPAHTDPVDVASHPLDVPIAVHLELLEHATAHVARVLREHGVSPSQVRVGVHLALGKPKPVIAKELGLKLSSVEDAARKLYERLDIHT